MENAETRTYGGKRCSANWVAALAKTPLGLIVVYYGSSILLTSLILLRFNVLLSVWTVRFNIIAYFISYYVIALLSLMWLFLRFHHKGGKKIANKTLLLVSLETLGCFTALVSISIIGNLPEYFILPVPLILILAVYIVRYRPARKSRKLVAPFLVVALVVSILMPIMAASASFDQTLKVASGIPDKTDQVKFISKTVLATTVRMDLVRANNDFEKLLLSGDGACGEGAIAMLVYLKKLGFDAREVDFPGEDHAFIEVEMNNTWQVVDPGYSLFSASRATRADRRVQEAGTVSYVAAYTEDGFTELTQQYVKTDTIIVRITQNGEPLAGTSVTFVHTLVTDGNARSMELPGHGFSFHTDVNGSLTIHLGKIGESVYNGSFTKTDPYYVIQVNGKPEQLRVNSTGTGLVKEFQINLAKP